MFEELFINKLYNDNFIQSLIKDIKYIEENPLRQIIAEIEEDLEMDCDEMTRFSEFLNYQIQDFYGLAEMNDDFSDNDPSYLFETNINNINTNINFNNSSNIISNKKEKFVDIDDWVQYIVADEQGEKKKKNKKKNKNGKKKLLQTNNGGNSVNGNNSTITNNSNTNDKMLVEINKDSIDLEFERFKQSINVNSKKSYLVYKIKPNLTEEWIYNISI
jgi:hypothetical protein